MSTRINRIGPLDGLRAISAFGVVWIHVWMSYGAPPFMLGGINFFQLITFLGNGVDFFFVISGFCMYLMLADKKIKIVDYLQFIKKRFFRIAPAYYLAVFIYAGILEWTKPEYNFWYNSIWHLLFMNNVVSGNTVSGPMWSIGTEWHFYLLLPLFLYVAAHAGLRKTLLAFCILAWVLFGLANIGILDYNWWESQVLVRFPEFAVGIWAANAFNKGWQLPKVLQGGLGLFLGFVILYLGRLMKFKPVLVWAGAGQVFFRTFSETIMTVGFGIICYHLITQRSRLSQWMASPFLTWLGRISYSIYLWHSLCIFLLWDWLKQLPYNQWNPIVAFALVSILLIPMSWVSYRLLEAFYFKRN